MPVDRWQRAGIRNRNPIRSDENSAGLIVLLEGWDNITQPEGRGPASVTKVQCS